MTKDAGTVQVDGSTRGPDEDLIRRMQADDLDAFETFFLRHRSSIYRTAYGLTGDPHAAEEVLQDTFARAYQRRSILRTDMSPLPWLHRVAINLCYSRLGRRRLFTGPIDDAEASLVRDVAIEPAERTRLIARMCSPCPPCVISPVFVMPSVVP